jgi:excisionase family DNA binding protein
MNKEESAEFLGRSVRQLERLVSAKRITSYKVKTSKGQVADFRVEDLERLKTELDEEEGRVVVHATLHQDSPHSTSEAIATLRPSRFEALSTESTALATVDHGDSLPVIAASSQEALPALAEVFAASLRILLSVADVCQRSQLSEKRVRDALRSGELKGKRIGHAWRIHRDDFEAWVRSLI